MENASINESERNLRTSEQSANSEFASNEENFQQPSSQQSASTINYRDGSSIDNQLCPLCLETYREIKKKGQTLVSTTCGHVFCKKCANQCLNSNCPTCRKKLTVRSIHPLYLWKVSIGYFVDSICDVNLKKVKIEGNKLNLFS